ncbi:Methylecgonone reductase [Glycine soja]
MEPKAIQEVELNSGHKMPTLGFGTGTVPLPPHHVLIPAFIEAIKSGYRHFDTAAYYGSEEPLGQAIALALDQGLIKSRNELFVTTKLWCTDAHPGLVLPALESSLQRLGLEYVDLYLIHFPVRLRQGVKGTKYSKGEILPLDMKGTWEDMERCSKLGLAKSIGVSNFGVKKLSEILQNARVPPALVQVEMNAAWQQENLRKFCKEKGIHVSAWSPLGANGAVWGSLAVMDSPILKDIAIKTGKTVAQVALRWIIEQGATPIVKSFNSERMKENLKLFDWELSETDSEKIKQIPQHRGFSGMGTSVENRPSNETLASIYVEAIEVGYRHFDTAAVYGTEEAIGLAVANAIEKGLIKSRDEVFITSKPWNTDARRDLIVPALKTTLKKLGTQYVDLYLIHWPEDFLPFDIEGTWKAMEECYKLGLAKSIGICNYGVKKLTKLLEIATFPPAVNQVEMNPSWQQGKLREFCKQKGIHVSAWSALGAYKIFWGSGAVMENPILQDIAKAKGKTIAQVALRWVYQQGSSAMAKSTNRERMKQNLDIFDFELSEEDLERISQVPQRRQYTGGHVAI